MLQLHEPWQLMPLRLQKKPRNLFVGCAIKQKMSMLPTISWNNADFDGLCLRKRINRKRTVQISRKQPTAISDHDNRKFARSAVTSPVCILNDFHKTTFWAAWRTYPHSSSNRRRLGKIDLLAKKLTQHPWFLYEIPPYRQRHIVRRAIALSLKEGKNLSQLIQVLPEKLLGDRQILQTLLEKAPAALAKNIAERFNRFYFQKLSIGKMHFKEADAEQFGALIRNRLLARYAERYDPRPLAVVVYPTKKDNTAFTWDRAELRRLMAGYRILYYEASKDYELAKNIKRATRRSKAYLLVIGGHGIKTHLSLGTNDPAKSKIRDESYYVDVSDWRDLISLRHRLVDGANIYVQSCSVAEGGKDANNVANLIARIFPQARVHASKVPSNGLMLTGANKLFYGLRSATLAVQRRNKGFYIEYDSSRHIKRFPHPPVKSKANPRLKERMLHLAMNNSSSLVRLAAAYELSAMKGFIDGGRGPTNQKSNDVHGMMIALKARDPYIRWNAARSLGDTGDTARLAVPSLVKRLSDKNLEVRNEAFLALKKIDYPAVVSALFKVVQRGNRMVAKMMRTADGRSTLVVTQRDWIFEWTDKKLKIISDMKAVPVLFDMLRHPKHTVRHRAAEVLGQIKHLFSAIALAWHTGDQNAKVREAIAHSLGKIGGVVAFFTLAKMFKDTNEYVRRVAIESMSSILRGDKSSTFTSILKDALKHQNPQIRSSVIKSLGIGSARGLSDEIMEALTDRNENVRRSAIEALGRLKVRKAVPALLQILSEYKDRQHGFGSITEVIIIALGRIGDQQAVPHLIALAKKDAYESGEIRSAAITALGRIGDPRALPVLQEALGEKSSIDQINYEAVDALGLIKDARVIAPLAEALKDPDRNVRMGAVKSLAKVGLSEAIPPLIRALEDKDRVIREFAARGLGNFKDLLSVKALVRTLLDTSGDAKLVAAESLGKMGFYGYPAVSALKLATQDGSRVMRKAARKALQSIERDMLSNPLLHSALQIITFFHDLQLDTGVSWEK